MPLLVADLRRPPRRRWRCCSPPASASARRERRESPLTTLRTGLTGRDHPDAAVRRGAPTAEPVDVSLADFLRATAEEGDPYLQVDDLTATLQDARARAVGVLPGRRR